MNDRGVSDSEFNMWRAVFAFSLVDNVLSMEEQDMLHSYFANVPFSGHQMGVLKEDFEHPKNVATMYAKITEKKDKERFCVLARALVWCEGDMDRQEELILKRLNCMKGSADEELVLASRHSPHLDDYYQYYAKAGVAGLLKTKPLVQMRI